MVQGLVFAAACSGWNNTTRCYSVSSEGGLGDWDQMIPCAFEMKLVFYMHDFITCFCVHECYPWKTLRRDAVTGYEPELLKNIFLLPCRLTRLIFMCHNWYTKILVSVLIWYNIAGCVWTEFWKQPGLTQPHMSSFSNCVTICKHNKTQTFLPHGSEIDKLLKDSILGAPHINALSAFRRTKAYCADLCLTSGH